MENCAWLSDKLAQDDKTQEKHLKEVGKLDFDPCADSTDPASCYRAIHAALEAMKKYGVEYLVVAANANYAKGDMTYGTLILRKRT